MRRESYIIGCATRMAERVSLANAFYATALDLAKTPWFVSDEATLYDIYAGEGGELVERCRQHYGVELRREHFMLPVWQLLDYLEANR